MGRLTRPDDATDSMTPRRRGCEGVPSGNLRPLGRRGGQLIHQPICGICQCNSKYKDYNTPKNNLVEFHLTAPTGILKYLQSSMTSLYSEMSPTIFPSSW